MARVEPPADQPDRIPDNTRSCLIFPAALAAFPAALAVRADLSTGLDVLAAPGAGPAEAGDKPVPGFASPRLPGGNPGLTRARTAVGTAADLKVVFLAAAHNLVVYAYYIGQPRPLPGDPREHREEHYRHLDG